MLKKFFSVFLLFSILICISASCNVGQTYISRNIFAMDTFVTIICESKNESDIDAAEDLLKQTEKTFSKTISSSDIARINMLSDCTVSSECANIIGRCLEIAENTNGAFNPAMGCIINLWDITGKKYIPTDEEIRAALTNCDYCTFQVSGTAITKSNSYAELDLGAAVKGYTAEKIITLLKENGVENAMISIGGNIAVTGEADGRNGFWRVAIKNPFNPDEIAGYIDCTDKVISVSGDYERYFEKDGIKYHHIFDYITGRPAENGIKSVAVIAEDGLISDAMSTALFCMGTQKALEFYNTGIYSFEAIIFEDDGDVILTDGIKDRFVLTQTETLEIK